MRILIIGLSGSGKTTLAKELSAKLNIKHLNADEIRNQYNDWDFSDEGRLRQANRIKLLADNYESVICDFIAPKEEYRKIIKADLIIWMDTVTSSNYPNTDKLFTKPNNFNYRITDKDAKKWCQIIINDINKGK